MHIIFEILIIKSYDKIQHVMIMDLNLIYFYLNINWKAIVCTHETCQPSPRGHLQCTSALHAHGSNMGIYGDPFILFSFFFWHGRRVLYNTYESHFERRGHMEGAQEKCHIMYNMTIIVSKILSILQCSWVIHVTKTYRRCNVFVLEG